MCFVFLRNNLSLQFSFKGDQQFVYNGDRTRDEIVQFAHVLSGPPMQEVTKTASLNNYTGQKKRSKNDQVQLKLK